MSESLERAGSSLRDYLFGRRYDLGSVAVGSDRLIVFMRCGRPQWLENRPMVWEGVPIDWHWNVGPAEAQATDTRGEAR
jgi:hypothetical protein